MCKISYENIYVFFFVLLVSHFSLSLHPSPTTHIHIFDLIFGFWAFIMNSNNKQLAAIFHLSIKCFSFVFYVSVLIPIVCYFIPRPIMCCPSHPVHDEIINFLLYGFFVLTFIFNIYYLIIYNIIKNIIIYIQQHISFIHIHIYIYSYKSTTYLKHIYFWFLEVLYNPFFLCFIPYLYLVPSAC